MTDVQQAVPVAQDSDVVRDIASETVCGFRVAAYRETHPEHGDKYGHTYSEHWSTPNTRNSAVRVERLFTETQLREALSHPCKSGEGAGEREAIARVIDPWAWEMFDNMQQPEPGYALKQTWLNGCDENGVNGAHARSLEKADSILALTPDATQTREAELRTMLAEARDVFERMGPALREHDEEGLAQAIAVAELLVTQCDDVLNARGGA